MHKRVSHINLSSYPEKKDEAGRLICLNCGGLLSGRRRKYCCDDCYLDWLSAHSHQFKRERMINKIGKCAKCGTTENVPNFILDHIKPIALGGAEFDDDNLQLLCPECDKEKTKKDQRKIAKARVRKKHNLEILKGGQKND